jgi:4-oxalocrotonate tautomerase
MLKVDFTSSNFTTKQLVIFYYGIILRYKEISNSYLLLVTILSVPIITVAMYSGRTQREKDRLAEAITEDVAKILKVEKKEVIIMFQEASHGNWYSSGIRM